MRGARWAACLAKGSDRMVLCMFARSMPRSTWLGCRHQSMRRSWRKLVQPPGCMAYCVVPVAAAASEPNIRTQPLMAALQWALPAASGRMSWVGLPCGSLL